MRIISFFLIAAWTLMTAMTDTRASDINVNIAVKTGGPDKPSSGSGGFVVDEGDYGRVSLTFPQDLGNYRVTSFGVKQGPVTRILGDEMYGASGDSEIALMSDIYLRPSVTSKGEIRLDGAMINMSREANTLLYNYSEEKIEFVLAKDGHHLVKLGCPRPGEDIYLDITANSTAEMIYAPTTTKYATLQTEYSLYNQDERKFELQECRAQLGFSSDDENASGSTSNWKIFDLPEDDSLLFISSFEVDKPRWESDGSLSFDFDLVHIYSINPENTASFPNEIKGEKTTIVTSSKKITISPGEKTEIEIPASTNSLLPFNAKETIILTFNADESR